MKLSSLPKNSKVAVLGGGISGLTFTYFLSKLRPDLNFQIFEKSSRIGGWINSTKIITKNDEEILLEKGPRTLRGIKDGSLIIVDILNQLGLENQTLGIHKNSIANKKYILNQEGEIVQVPNNIASIFHFLKNVKWMDGKLYRGILKESFIKPLKQDETIEQFFKRRFGSTVITDNIASAILHGVYAGDVGKLSIKSVLPFLKQIENESGSVIKHIMKSMTKKKQTQPLSNGLQSYCSLISPNTDFTSMKSKLKDYPMITFQDGLEVFPIALSKYLQNKTNVKIHSNSKIESVDPIEGIVNGEKFNHIRSTINVHDLAKTLPPSNPLIPKLNSIEYISIFLANVFTKNQLIPKNKPGFGFLVPRFQSYSSNPQALLGIVYDSDVEKNAKNIFKNTPLRNFNYDKITIMMGGHYYNHWNIPSDKVNLKIVKDILKSKLNINLDKFNLKIVNPGESIESINDNDLIISYDLITNCIPQYNLGYQEIKTDVESILNQDYKLSFGGTVFGDGIGVPDCVINSFKDALKLK
ncbi:unnamed protein product [Candida verbasci]|uniref:Protoporphyrinogen oxidase n=1 Tax=Candida verbasci TaxID=1227364 RepID=A0A9W4XKB2_9ASCO|nr:unnamed protein product [Candida verbasci]